MKSFRSPGFWLNLISVLALIVLALLPGIDQQAEGDYDALFKRAVVTFALARTLNGAISVVQGTELDLAPAGIGVTLKPGEILDPVNDLVERFSWIMLAASTSVGVQSILLDVSGWWGVKLVVAVLGGLLLLLLLWRREQEAPLRDILVRAFLIALFIRFAVPVLLIANDAVYEVFLEPRYTESTEVITSASADLEQMGEQANSEVSENDDRNWFSRTMDNARDQLNLKQRVAQFQARAQAVVEHIIQLSAVFLVQTVVLPLLFLWLLAEFFKRLIRWRPVNKGK